MCAHLPLLVAPDGSKLSKRRHGPVVSVTTYRDEGFLPEAFINFLCLLGWSPKDDREKMTRQELVDAFSLEGINRANAVVNFKESATTPEETFDPKAVWLNAEHIRGMAIKELSARLRPIVLEAGFQVTPEENGVITPLIRERIKLLRDVLTAADFFFVDELPPYDPAELIPQKGDAAMALKVLTRTVRCWLKLSSSMIRWIRRSAALLRNWGLKLDKCFSRYAWLFAGEKNAPPLFETLEVLGRDKALIRIEQAIRKLK